MMTDKNNNDNKNKDQLVGRRVAGYFHIFGEYFEGTVVSVSKHKRPIYHIQYDDGDEEDVYYNDKNAEDERDLSRMLAVYDKLHPNNPNSIVVDSNGIDKKNQDLINDEDENIGNDDNDGENDDDDDDFQEEEEKEEEEEEEEEEEMEEQMTKRRSGRKRTLTTVTIGKHTVLAKNNYSVRGIGGYVFDTQARDVPVDPYARRSSKKKAKKKQAQPRKRSQVELQRVQHNQDIKLCMEQDTPLRHGYLASKVDILSPFIHPKVQSFLRSKQTLHRTTDEFKLASQPDIVTTTLRDYQMIGLEWMLQNHKRGLPMILGDEMGLGKTLQTISLLAYLKESFGYQGPSLIVVPLSVLYSWGNEIQLHAPSLTHFRLHSTENERDAVLKELNERFLEYDVVVTTYDMLKTTSVRNFLRGLYFHYLVLDEGHAIKNSSSQISEAVRRVHCQNKLVLTGTPLQNNLVELYAILNFLCPDIFTESSYFENAFDIGKGMIDSEMLLKANKVLGVFMLRRLKEEVEKLMPKKIETKILCPLSSNQIFWYKGFLMNEIDLLIRATEDSQGENANKAQILRNLVMQLRKICLHPFLFDFAERNPDETSVQELISSSGKLAVLDMLLRSLFQKGHRTVLFSQFTKMLDIIEDYCILRGWRYCRFDGGTPRGQRNHLIKQFNAPDSDIFIFLMSTRSGGLGINLQTADTCILYDSDWNPQPDLQAMARVHRIGQTKTVHVYRLVSCGTVEERVLERAEKKLFLDQMVNRGASAQNTDDESGGGLSTEDLLRALKFGSNAVFSSSNDLPSDADISILTDRNRSEDDTHGILQGGVANTAQSFDKDKKLTDTQTFEGINFREFRDSQQPHLLKKKGKLMDSLKIEWAGLLEQSNEIDSGKRKRKNRIINVAGKGSGYGKEYVPVLAGNNYDLDSGEPSVWTETKRKMPAPPKKKTKKVAAFRDNQDFCQVCGDGGFLILCPSCPVSVHEECCGMTARQFMRCSHHRCSTCDRNVSTAGGLLFPCQSCPGSFCDDCLPKDVQIIDGVGRFATFGHEPDNKYVYIHCSKICENIAKREYGWKRPEKKILDCPVPIDVSYAFGAGALSVKEIAMKHAGVDITRLDESNHANANVSNVSEDDSTSAPKPENAANIGNSNEISAAVVDLTSFKQEDNNTSSTQEDSESGVDSSQSSNFVDLTMSSPCTISD